MKTCLVCACVLALMSGCARRTYEIDFSQVRDFEWDGKLKITKVEGYHLGPLLTFESDWSVERVELAARDGRTARVEAGAGDSTPTAQVGPGGPLPVQPVGADMWDRAGTVMIADPDLVAAALQAATTQPTSRPSEIHLLGRSAADELRPYAAHVDKLALAEWWAIALSEANEVTVEFDIPEEGLHILMRGNPHEYGPAVLEVRSADGRLLARFARQQIPVTQIDKK